MRTASKALLAAALAGTGILATPASARTYISVGIGGPAYPRYYGGYRPVYYPGYYPGYYAPPVVYGGYYGPPGYYGRPWRGYYHRGYYGRHWR